MVIQDRISQFVAKFARSWGFVIFELAFVAAWVILNSTKLAWDRYPFELLKLVLFVEAFVIIPLVLLEQHRETEYNRKILIRDYVINFLTRRELKANKSETDQVLEILKKNDHS